jgi:hypothetical protein
MKPQVEKNIKQSQYKFMLDTYRKAMRDVSPAEQRKLDKKFKAAMRVFKRTGRWPKS